MKYIITILLLTLSAAIWAQVEVGDVVTDKHKLKIEKKRNPRKKLKKYRKYYSKDSTRLVKKMEKEAEYKMDSIGKVLKARLVDQENALPELPSITNEDEVKQEIESRSQKVIGQVEEAYDLPIGELKQVRPDSSQVDRYKDRAIEQVQNQIDLPVDQEYIDELKNLKLDSTQIADYKAKGKARGQAAMEDVEKRAAKEAGIESLSAEQMEFDEIKNTPEKYKKLAEEYQDKEKLKEKAKKASKEKAAAFFAANQELLFAEQKKMGLLKNKYASLLNSNDLSSGVKVNSLKGKPFRERLILGGNFQMVETKPLILSATPEVGYRFNRKLSAGLGANLRISQATEDTNLTKKNNGDTKGGKAFLQYVILKKFQAIAEYELMSVAVADSTSDVVSREWVPGLLLGIGKQFSVHPKVNATISALYNFTYDVDKSPYDSPFVFKFGFQLSKLAWLRK